MVVLKLCDFCHFGNEAHGSFETIELPLFMHESIVGFQGPTADGFQSLVNFDCVEFVFLHCSSNVKLRVPLFQA